MTKKWFWLSIVIGTIVFVGGPLFIQYNHWPRGSNGNGDWLSFWGSYLGIIPSGLIAFIVSKNETSKQYRNDLKKQIDFEDLKSIFIINNELNDLMNRIQELDQAKNLVGIPGLHPLIQPLYNSQGEYLGKVQEQMIGQTIQVIRQNIPIVRNNNIEIRVSKIEENFQNMSSTLQTKNQDVFCEQLLLAKQNVICLQNYVNQYIKNIYDV